MKILWVTNLPLPEVSNLMNQKPSPFGGWLINTSKFISDTDDIELYISFPLSNINEVKSYTGVNIKYIAFPSVNKVVKDKDLMNMNNVIGMVKPDLVHVFGTEYPHSLAMVEACKGNGIEVVISIQGLVSVYAEHFLTGLPTGVTRGFTIRDLLKIDNIHMQKKKFEKNGELEIKAIKNVKHIIGRTTWDKACTRHINPESKYYFCNENLRGEFYSGKWEEGKCEKYSIFVSQGSYPVKGLHFILKAMPLILKFYPQARLYIGGTNIISSESLKDRLKRGSYGKYIKKLIKENLLEDKVFFTGVLGEKQMKEYFLKANVFVSPSLIENSPNSLGEAMILGVPSVASGVGGVSDLFVHEKDGFVYQLDAPYMLAHYVCEIFKNSVLAQSFSKSSSEHARKTHNIEDNTRIMIDIYREIINTNKM